MLIRDLIASGSILEDSPADRVRHHFHNPLLTWDAAGLRVGVQIGQSSVLWQQERNQDRGGRHGWHDGRESYYRALTVQTKAERERQFAETFQTVGHLIHLVQDAASPSHTRNDAHLSYSNLGDVDGFHAWADRPGNLDRITGAVAHDPSILKIAANPLAPLPIARIIDTERYRQSGVPAAGVGIGMAEYSNANFFSDDTIFRGFPFPAATSVELGPPETLPNGRQRQYFRKVRDGEVIAHLATPSALYRYLPGALKPFAVNLDERVFQDYGDLLLPRAVGYSAGLIDYFFRGKIDLDVEYDTSTEGQYVIKNDGDEMMKGDFTLYYDGVDGKRYPLAGDSDSITWRNVTVEPNMTSAPLKAPKMPSDPKPKTGEYFLVFKGEMGEEKPINSQSVGAVVAKNKQKLFWEPWREELTDNRPWVAGAGTVNNQVGPNSQEVQNGQLVEYAGAGGAGFVVWKAANVEDMLPTQFMKLGITCSENAMTTNWNVYGYLFIAPTINGQIDWGHSQAIPFAGGAGPSSGFDLMNKKIPVTPTEYVVDLRLLYRLGLKQIGYMSIETIGFDMDLTCSVDYLDFSEEPFEKVSESAVYYP